MIVTWCCFFFKSNRSEAGVMKRILTRYENISGQMVNYNKSSVTFSHNTDEETGREVCTELGVLLSESPGKYLGLPMTMGRNKVANFGFLHDRVEQKLQVWGNQTLSNSGKVTLLKTAAQSIPNFWMNLFLIPGEVCGKIERRMNAFWWG